MNERSNHWTVIAFSIVALGIGFLIGITASSGLAMSGDHVARFTGAFFGSLIAVAGAVALYYLREQNDERRRRAHMRKMLERLQRYIEGIPGEFEDANSAAITAALNVTERYLARVKRFCDNHEFDDDRISDVSARLDSVPPGFYTQACDAEHDYDDELKKVLVLACDNTSSIVSQALSDLENDQ